MRLEEFIEAMERIAPPELALPFDNVGLLVGPDHREISHVLVALDLSVATAKEALEIGADLVLTHHPRFLSGIKCILPEDPETAPACILLRNGVGHYAAHTNLDACAGGVNDALAEKLGLIDIAPLPPSALGRIGRLDQPMTLLSFAKRVEERLDTVAQFVGEPDALISRVAVAGGSGGDELFAAAKAGAELFVTGELKHHMAYTAEALHINALAAGHYETEAVIRKPLIARLQQETNDVQYSLARSESAPFRRC